MLFAFYLLFLIYLYSNLINPQYNEIKHRGTLPVLHTPLGTFPHRNLTIKGVRTSFALPGSKTGILGALWRRFEKQKQTSQISEL